MAAAAAALVLGSGCFDPRFESGQLQCAGGDICPAGFYCARPGGRCWRVGELPTDDGGVGQPDASGVLPPTLVEPAVASPSPVQGTTVALSVLADDERGEPNLIYTWTLKEPPPGLVGFSDNATNSAKNTTAIFTTAGRYSFTVTIENRARLTTSSMLELDVEQRVNDLALTPSMATVPPGGMQQFTATAFDQFGSPLTLPQQAKWVLAGGCGVVSDSGLFQAASTVSGSCTITATLGAVSVNATVSVGTAVPLVLAPVADTYVEESSPDRNFGPAGSLLVKTQSGSQNNRISYLQFSLAGVPAPVAGATLRLFGKSVVATHNDGVFIVNGPWLESSVTWRSRPALGARVAGIGVTTAPKYHEWNVTSAVQALQAAGGTLFSIAIQMEASTSDGPDTFESREATNKPQLVLTP